MTTRQTLFFTVKSIGLILAIPVFTIFWIAKLALDVFGTIVASTVDFTAFTAKQYQKLLEHKSVAEDK